MIKCFFSLKKVLNSLLQKGSTRKSFATTHFSHWSRLLQRMCVFQRILKMHVLKKAPLGRVLQEEDGPCLFQTSEWSYTWFRSIDLAVVRNFYALHRGTTWEKLFFGVLTSQLKCRFCFASWHPAKSSQLLMLQNLFEEPEIMLEEPVAKQSWQ